MPKTPQASLGPECSTAPLTEPLSHAPEGRWRSLSRPLVVKRLSIRGVCPPDCEHDPGRPLFGEAELSVDCLGCVAVEFLDWRAPVGARGGPLAGRDGRVTACAFPALRLAERGRFAGLVGRHGVDVPPGGCGCQRAVPRSRLATWNDRPPVGCGNPWPALCGRSSQSRESAILERRPSVAERLPSARARPSGSSPAI
jgi:hypothetical protein